MLSRLGFDQFVIVVDFSLAAFEERIFHSAVNDFERFSAAAGITGARVVPLALINGTDGPRIAGRMPCFEGPALSALLSGILPHPTQQAALRIPVKLVDGSEPGRMRVMGVISSGVARTGARVRLLPSGCEAHIEHITTGHGERATAACGQAVTLVLTGPTKVSGVDLISDAQHPASVADQFQTTLLWCHDTPMLPGRNYLMRIGNRTVNASVTEIKQRIDPDTLETSAAKELTFGAIAECNLAVAHPIAFDAFVENPETGCYLLFDAEDGRVGGAGTLNFALRRSQNIHRQHMDVNKQARSTLKRQAPCVLWFTGLSGAGKSTIANALERRLHELGHHTYLLDGDNVRHGLNRDLGFTAADRVENIRRIAEVAKLMVDAGLIVATAFISPFRAERQMARSLLEHNEFIEIFVDTPLEVAEQRDVKGLYRKARGGELKNFTGIDSPYEPPEFPELRMDTTKMSADEAAEQVIRYLGGQGFIH
ncbi:MAG: adenylyl-sulfate kinase [Thiohalomonadaceae bacterium]